MDTNKFVKAIQTLIKEEVRKQVAKEKLAIRESIIQEMNKPQPTKKVKKPNVKFKDGKFSDLLNETVDNWPTMGGGTLTANNAQGMDRQTMASMMGLSSQPTPQSIESHNKPSKINSKEYRRLNTTLANTIRYLK